MNYVILVSSNVLTYLVCLYYWNKDIALGKQIEEDRDYWKTLAVEYTTETRRREGSQ